jgi:hypothetical protein
MSSLTNVNNNAAVVVVGRTAPVPPGQQPAAKSIPVVLASDQTPIPVVEQNKIASEVALSLLGIPRAEVALGIFADVNTYDVNPSEWSSQPEIRQELLAASDPAYSGFSGIQGWGTKHIPAESGALIEAPADKVSILTSKRFFRYQPGRVSAATFGVSTSIITGAPNGDVRNPAIRKYGAFDSFDGYYWETRDTGRGDQLAVVRRTSSLLLKNPIPFGTSDGQQLEDYGVIGAVAGSTEAAPGLPNQELNLIVLRDGLVHVHAAVYDPSLLRNETLHTISAITANALTLSKANGIPELFNGQHVTYQTDATAISNLVKQKIYKIVEKTIPIGDVYTVKLAEVNSTTAITLGTLSGVHSLKTPVPFLFPEIGTQGAGDIMWPLQRSFDIDGNPLAVATPQTSINTIGAITTTQANILAIINGSITNELHWKNWVKWNVKPEFYNVYEYRVPRSRFSGDFLNGVQQTETTDAQKVLYSDVVRTGAGDDTIKRPGDSVIDEATNSILTKESIWNLDFTKVTMQKVEYSWYGAVGALFLAYVPVSNGEARWVRVHHIRCSNQLKVPSLGNPTLPITYLVYGGGSENRYGYTNNSSGSKRLSNQYGTYSEYIVKYGASYYIDGGDRGTVRLYSYSSPNATEVYGSKYRMKTVSVDNSIAPYLEINETAPYNVNPVVSDFYMGATVLTSDVADQGVKVIWVDTSTKRLYLNKALNFLSGVVKLDVLVDRPQITYGLKTKTQIVSSQGSAVRNRVQVYPTRLAIGSSGNSVVSVQLRKNPIFQTYSAYTGTLTLTVGTGTVHILKPEGQPTALTLSSTPTFADGLSAYGWIQGYFTDDPNLQKFSIFGLLRRVGSTYTFTAETSFSREVRIVGTFLHAKNYDNDGSIVTTPSGESEIQRLSSVTIANELRTPIPGTGTQITTFFIGSGGFQFDLSPYFDYNKDYLSYPLTNKIDSLYLTSTSVSNYINVDGSGDPTGSPVLRSSVLSSLTWEEQ